MVKDPVQKNRALSPADQELWDSYIKGIYSAPEQNFRPPKSRNNGLRRRLDLHGMTIQQAFHRVNQFVDEHFSEGSYSVTVITGKGGKIADEFPAWCGNLPQIRSIEPMVDAAGEIGSWTIYLRKIKKR